MFSTRIKETYSAPKIALAISVFLGLTALVTLDPSLFAIRQTEAISTQSYAHVISENGLDNIANHQYVSGGYTHLDELLDPAWTWMADQLPLWLSPNEVTMLGALHAFLLYLVVSYYTTKTLGPTLPSWTIWLAGYCTWAYTTLDTLDGKQARRTGLSSPLGQLVDHGVDALVVMVHCEIISASIGLKHHPSLILQSLFQFGFLVAQWEEYHTHVLPTSSGRWIGTTELNYALILFILWNASLGAQGRTAFWSQSLRGMLSSQKPLPLHQKSSRKARGILVDIQLRYICCYGLAILVGALCLASIQRVYQYYLINGSGDNDALKLLFAAAYQLSGPLLVAFAPVCLLPAEFVFENRKAVSVATGLALALLTIKVIVFSMAKMPIQNSSYVIWEVVPVLVLCLWKRVDYSSRCQKKRRLSDWKKNVHSSPAPRKRLLVLLCLFLGVRLALWTYVAVTQISQRSEQQKPHQEEPQVNIVNAMQAESFFVENCESFAPECEAHEVLSSKWGEAAVHEYGGKESCCKIHGFLRIATLEVFAALESQNVTAWLDGGSTLGIARHNGTQIPWDYDSDIAFLVQGEHDEEPPVLGLPSVPAATLDDFMFSLVAVLNQTTAQRYGSGDENVIHWSVDDIHPNGHDSCIQYHLNMHVRSGGHGGDDATMKAAYVDLFGVQRSSDQPPKLIDGATRESVNYPKCFHKETNEHTYYTLPPVRCRFYDNDDAAWCPRDINGYIKHYFGPSALQSAVSHDGFYGENYVPGGGDLDNQQSADDSSLLA